MACHNGTAVGGGSFQKMGLHADYKTASKAEGRIAVTERCGSHEFQGAILRNVELTYPTFTTALPGRWKRRWTMGGCNSCNFSKGEIGKIVAFLKTLTGKQPDFSCRFCRRPRTDARPRPFSNRCRTPWQVAGGSMPCFCVVIDENALF